MSLLSQVKAVPASQVRSEEAVSADFLEVAIAYSKREVNQKQISKALKIKESAVTG